MIENMENFVGATCEIKSKENTLLCIGTIHMITDGGIEISAYRNDELHIIPLDAVVKISARHRTSFCVLEGNVYVSGPTRLVLKNVKRINNTERRAFFRVPTGGLNAKLYRFVGGQRSSQAIDIVVKNMSLSGILFSVNDKTVLFENEEKLSVDLNLSGTDVSIDIVMKRMERESGTEDVCYGCILPNMSEREKDILCNYIFTKERELLKANRRV